ncbi:hypothetical protein AVEN_98268-1 [Araneus ventricosus]|uniref:Uncharacterized protein n=1 Tax=Araneus ventricosus TaxID=182803 RepID=A0A4Y2A9B9_ARAVE|nr:hypothetical protein AVEN_98268-1 [Araneus ventricosus]
MTSPSNADDELDEPEMRECGLFSYLRFGWRLSSLRLRDVIAFLDRKKGLIHRFEHHALSLADGGQNRARSNQIANSLFQIQFEVALNRHKGTGEAASIVSN